MYRVLFILLTLFVQNTFGQNLINAIKDNNIQLAKKLIKKGESVNQTDVNGATPLMWAVLKTDLSFCKFLVSKGANPKMKGVIYLDSSQNQYYGNLQGICSMNGKYDIMEWLVRQLGLSINEKEYNKEDNAETGWTALQFAVYKGDEQGIDKCIELGADINYLSSYDSANILLDAINYGHIKIARKIITSYKINLNHKNMAGFSALHYAAYLNNLEVIELLIEKGGNINVQSDSLFTPLHMALNNYLPLMVRRLIEGGADTSLQNKWGQTVGSIARANGYKGIQNILKRNYESLIYPCYDSLYLKYEKYYNADINDSIVKYSTLLYVQAQREFYPNTGKYGESLNYAGIGYYNSKQYKEALKLFKLSLEHLKKYRTTDTLSQIQYNENIIKTYDQLGQEYKSVESYLNEVMDLKKIYYGDTSLRFFDAWRLKLYYLQQESSYSAAIEEYTKLLNYCIKYHATNTISYYNTVNTLFVLYAKNGDMASSLTQFEEIKKAWVSRTLPSKFDFIEALQSICILLTSESDTLYSKPYLSLYRSLLLNQKPFNVTKLYTYSYLKGKYFFNCQKYDSSFLCYKSCISLSRLGAEVTENDIAYTYLRSAQALIKSNLLELADIYLDTAIYIFSGVKEINTNYYGEVYTILITYYGFEEYAVVKKLYPILYKMALVMNDTSYLLQTIKIPVYYNFKLSNYDKAKNSVNEVIELEKKFYKRDPKLRIPFYIEVARFNMLINDTLNAINYFNQILKVARPLNNYDSIQLSVNYQIAKLRIERGNIKTGEKWLESEVKRIEAQKKYNDLEKQILITYIETINLIGNEEEASRRCKYWMDIFENREFKSYGEWGIKQGDVFGSNNHFDKAEQYYKTIYALLKEKFGEDSPEMILINAKLGNIYFRSNQYDLSLPFFKKTIELEEKNGVSKQDLKSYYNSLKLIYFGINDMQMSEKYSDKLLEINANDIKSDFKTYLKSRTDHIFIKQQVGKYDEAESIANDLLQKMYKYSQFGMNDKLEVYMMIGSFYSEIGNKDKAILCVDSSYSIAKNYYKTNTDLLSSTCIRTALIYLNNGKGVDGLNMLRNQYLNLKNKVSDTLEYYNETINYLGLSYLYFKQLDSAIAVLKLVKDHYLSKNIYNIQLNTTLKYLAAAFIGQKHYDSAMCYMKLARKGALNRKGKLEEYWEYNLEIANLYGMLKYYDSCQAILDEILVKDNNKLGITAGVNKKAQLYKAYNLYDQGEYDESYNYLEKCMLSEKLDILDKILFLSAAERENFISSKSNNFRNINSNLVKYCSKFPRYGSIILDNEIFIKGLALETNTRLLQLASSSDNKTLNELLDKIKTGKNKLDKLYLQPNPNEMELLTLQNNIASWEKELNKNLGQNFKEDYLKNYTLEMKQKLRESDVLVDFFSRDRLTDKDKDTIPYYAIILGKNFEYPKIIRVTDNVSLNTLFSNQNGLDDQTQLAQIYETRGTKFLNKNSSLNGNCYQIIWQKIDSVIKGKKNIYITPSGYLNKIAFAAIKDTNNVFISDKYNIHILTSSRQILKTEKKIKSRKKLGFIFGGIDYENDSIVQKSNVNFSLRSYTFDTDSTRSGFSYLPGTANETKKIVSHLSGKQFEINYFTGKNATEEIFKKAQNKSPYFIHIATHGFYLPETNTKLTSISGGASKFSNPLLRSGLLFAGGNKAWLGKPIEIGKEDGILNSFEISNLDLRQTKFVVLSACETGLGDIKGSEGIFGLQRAFKLAGVEYLINSLWQVPDEQTSELMQNLYLNWAKGATFEEAFFMAQKTLKAKYPPYYWAAFQLVK